MVSPVDDDLALALRLADVADAVTLPRFRAADLHVRTKPDRSPVTDADTACEDALRALIAAERPTDAVLGEEGGGSVAGAARGWVLDPIDGTKNFSRAMPAWGTLIALTVEGEAVVGVASAPALGRRWWGASGLGAWTTDAPGAVPRRIAVSGVSELGDAYLSTTDLRLFGQQGRMDRWLALVDAVWETRAFGDFWQHVLVAEGVLDVAVDPVANPWDLAALVPIVAEAGGRMTDLTGAPTWSGGDALTTNGALHAAALSVVGR
jgi:histidinol-phosphatase